MVVSTLFAWLARLRRSPAFHPRGVLLAGRLVVTDPDSGLAAALGGAASGTAVLVRLSKAIGIPAGYPDLLGFAMRIQRPGRGPVDLLLTSTGRHRVTDNLLAPARGWLRNPYSTLLPYRTPHGRAVLRVVAEDPERAVGARPADVVAAVEQMPPAFTLLEGRRAVGRIVLEREEHGDIALDPVLHADAALRPTRVLTTVRERAYQGSRTGRNASGLGRAPVISAGTPDVDVVSSAGWT
jgi:hypothetical protein